jgi:L-ascorbate metabolism protein UlaG (beta-lactamase superfamily)
MGLEDGLKTVRLLRPRITIPMHYNTWDLIDQDVDAFRETVANKTISKCLVMMPGSTQNI